jgi:hypothetical protein
MSNSAPSINVPVPEILMPALVHALAIARNRAMLSGEPLLQKALEDLRAQLAATLPPASKGFVDTKWSELALAVFNGAAFDVQTTHPRFCRMEKAVDVTIYVANKDPLTTSETRTREDAEQLRREVDDFLTIVSPILSSPSGRAVR